MKSRRANHLAAWRSPGFGLRRQEYLLKALSGNSSPCSVSKNSLRQRVSGRLSRSKLFYSLAIATACCFVCALIINQQHQTATDPAGSVATNQDRGFDTELRAPSSKPSPSGFECSGSSRDRDFGGVLVKVRFDCESKPWGWLVIDKKESGAGSTDHSPTRNPN